MKVLGIIGMGPRGLYALEKAIEALSKSSKEVKFLVFEPSDKPGAGNVWHPNQSDSNWINITTRALESITSRPELKINSITIEAFPSFHDWIEYSQSITDPDSFPPRKILGHYLYKRFVSIMIALDNSELFSVIKEDVIKITLEQKMVKVVTKNSSKFQCDEVLITIGHQPTYPSEQIEKWQQHTNKFSTPILKNTYPISHLDDLKNKKDINIGIRGFGLAMIDAMRAITINNFGNFKRADQSTFESYYYKTDTQNIKLVPFSLDGKPMVPKPYNELIDNIFKPTYAELDYLKTEIKKRAHTNNKVNNIDFLKLPISRIISRIYRDIENRIVGEDTDSVSIEKTVLKWLNDENYTHTLLQRHNIATYALIESYIEMALDEQEISLDYCAGQVWRHCQPIFYKELSHANLEDEIIKTIISLDERIKRYSYGPPIESMQQMLALVDAGILTLDFVNNPTIETVSQGWKLTNSKGQKITTSVMIDSVLDSPELLNVNASLIQNLLSDDLIKPVHSELGIATFKNGLVKSSHKNKEIPIAVLGRLAKGSVIGVDAILECFGPRIIDWAEGLESRV